jgi:hypothetical protein
MSSDERERANEAETTHTDGQESSTVTCRIDGATVADSAIDLPATVNPETVLAAIRDRPNGVAADGDADEVIVDCPPPGPLFEHVGHVHLEMGLRTKTALARAGRSRGMATPYDDDIADAQERLAGVSVPNGNDDAKREAVAAHEHAADELRERVAAARGRLQARRSLDGDTGEAAADLREAIRDLTDHETEAIAARQELAAAEQDARERRNLRERRFELEEEIANLEREARTWLVEQLRAEYADALAALQEATADDPFAAEPVTAALAVARVGEPSAPLVLDCGRFDSAVAAREWLGCPVIRLGHPEER